MLKDNYLAPYLEQIQAMAMLVGADKPTRYTECRGNGLIGSVYTILVCSGCDGMGIHFGSFTGGRGKIIVALADRKWYPKAIAERYFPNGVLK